MKNIHLIASNRPSRLFYLGNNSELLLSKELVLFRTFERSPQNIYITTNDKFSKDQYITDGIEVIKASSKLVEAQGLVNRRDWKKIILTTDQDLIKDGVQAIEDEFLEWFVKNPSCERVEVEIESKFDRVDGHYHDVWEIIIPKEESEQENLFWDELIREAGSEEQLMKILKLPHIAPLVREAMRNECKK